MGRRRVRATLEQAAEIAADTGVHVAFEPGWTTAGRVGIDPVGVVNHTTEDPAPLSRDRAVELYSTGHGALSGNILYNVLIARDASVRVLGCGVAWHAGRGQFAGHGGNHAWLGVAYQRARGQQLTARQLDAGRVVDAALCVAFGWDAAAVLCEHFEYAQPRGRKRDRLHRDGARMDADRWRRDIAALIDELEGGLIVRAEDEDTIRDIVRDEIKQGLNELLAVEPSIADRNWASLQGSGGNRADEGDWHRAWEVNQLREIATATGADHVAYAPAGEDGNPEVQRDDR